MNNSNIFIIQNDLRKLKKALSYINPNSYNNFFYKNCISHFYVDNVAMCTKNFNSFLYCQDTNTYIIFSKDNFEKISFAKKYMDKNSIQYHEISFKNEPEDIINRYPNTLYCYEKSSKEIWSVSNNDELKMLFGSLLKFNSTSDITFYPLLTSNIRLSYSNNSDEELRINKFCFEGILTVEDKIILLKKYKDKNKISVQNVFDELNIILNTVRINRPKFINVEEKRNKKFEAEYKSDKAKLLTKTYY